MKIKEGASITGLHPVMRPVLKASESIWVTHGRDEGVTITGGLDGTHSAGSWHYYGLAVDLRTHYFDDFVKKEVAADLIDALPEYDVVVHSTHIHVEVGNNLAKQIGVYF